MRGTKAKKAILYAPMANLYDIQTGMAGSLTTIGTMKTVQKYLSGDCGTIYHAITVYHIYARNKKVGSTSRFF